MYASAATKRLEDLADADLVHRVKRGDDEALAVLLRRYMDDLYRFCCHLVSNRQDAEDICQESLTRAIDRADTLERGSAFRGWLFRIARNLSVDVFRQRRRICTLLDEEEPPPPLRFEGPQEAVVVGEEHQTVAQALSRLAQRHKEVLLLREVEGLSYADIGEHLHVSHAAVETLLFRARRRLREEYRQAQLSSVGGLIHPTRSSVHLSRSASG
jgi:RNA polymerase sigma factor (sigma-70 family)